MESRPPRWGAPPPGPLAAPWLLGLLLSPWTLPLAGMLFLLLTCSPPCASEPLSSTLRRAANSRLGGFAGCV